MKKEEVQTIMDQLDELSPHEVKLLRYVRMSSKTRLKAKNEPIEPLKDQYYNLSSLNSEIAELQLLQDMLSSFFLKYKLKDSLLKPDDFLQHNSQQKELNREDNGI